MVLSVVLVLVALGMARASIPVPDFIQICKRNDPELRECLMRSVEALRPILQTGRPDYNIPSVEPIIIDELIREEAAGLKLTITNVQAHGGGDFIVTDFKSNFDAHKYEVDVKLPKIVAEGKYVLDGKLIMVPIRGNGDFYANLTDCSAKVTMQGEVYMKDGEEKCRFASNKLRIKVGSGHLRLDNLFNGDKTINDLINDTINKNLGAFMKELMPYIEKGLGDNFLKAGNDIIEPYAYKDLFPE